MATATPTLDGFLAKGEKNRVIDNVVGDPLKGTIEGFASGAVSTLALVGMATGAGIAGYLVGDQLPQVINSTVLNAAAVKVPAGFGIPYALSVPEAAIFGHRTLAETPMWGLAVAAVGVKEYLVPKILGPLGHAVFGHYQPKG